MLTIEVLVKAVVIVGTVLEQKWCRSDLAGLVAPFDEVCMRLWIANIDTHRPVPSIGDRNKMRIDGRPEPRDKAGQWIAEILVFATPETMAFHHDMTAKNVVLLVEAGYRLAFICRKKTSKHRATLCVKVLRNLVPSD